MDARWRGPVAPARRELARGARAAGAAGLMPPLGGRLRRCAGELGSCPPSGAGPARPDGWPPIWSAAAAARGQSAGVAAGSDVIVGALHLQPVPRVEDGGGARGGGCFGPGAAELWEVYFAMPDDSGLSAVLQDDAAVQWAMGRAHQRVLGSAAAQEG